MYTLGQIRGTSLITPVGHTRPRRTVHAACLDGAMSRRERPVLPTSGWQVTCRECNGFESRQIDDPAGVIDVDPHQGAVGIEVENHPRRDLPGVGGRSIGEVDVERVSVRKIVRERPRRDARTEMNGHVDIRVSH